MESLHAYFVLADISGYTRFIRTPRLAAIHAEHLVNTLLGSVVESARYPLHLHKIEGDAVAFYAEAPDTAEAASDVVGQVRRFFDAFCGTQTIMLAADVCACEACSAVGELRLKVVVHWGEVVRKHLHGFTELAGPEVVLAHRLLKAPVPNREHLLLTSAVPSGGDVWPNAACERRSVEVPDFGAPEVTLCYPGTAPPAEVPRAALHLRAMAWGMLNLHGALRLLGVRRPRALPGVPPAEGASGESDQSSATGRRRSRG